MPFPFSNNLDIFVFYFMADNRHLSYAHIFATLSQGTKQGIIYSNAVATEICYPKYQVLSSALPHLHITC